VHAPAARVDAFTSEGLSESTQSMSTLEDAAACLSTKGLLLVNLHTGDVDDPDHWIARRVLRKLCARFDSVYSMLCSTTQNLIALCHQGDLLDADVWESRLAAQLARKDVSAACKGFDLNLAMSRFDFIGGKDQPMSDDDEEAAAAAFADR
jgi:hypothetical protein